ncbi:hypothetical protein [Candidatus Amarobacter glycogenicus]|uniref:hypothetical protein n=1 Tax=Candidatus Amarobacter glycogenicus TaxID=3140699 RepID=UPI0031CC8ED8
MGDEAQLRQARGVVRMDDLHMLDAVAQRRPGSRRLGLAGPPFWFGRAHQAQRVQHMAVGAVADGVNHHAEAGRAARQRLLGKLLRVQRADAAPVRPSPIRLQHPGCLRAERAVGKELDAAQAQPVVAEAALQAQINGRLTLRAGWPG